MWILLPELLKVRVILERNVDSFEILVMMGRLFRSVILSEFRRWMGIVLIDANNFLYPKTNVHR
jgi:hypothetical protein